MQKYQSHDKMSLYNNIDSLKIIYKKSECFVDLRIATPPRRPTAIRE